MKLCKTKDKRQTKKKWSENKNKLGGKNHGVVMARI